MVAHGFGWGKTIEAAARNHHAHILAWARAHGCPWADDPFRYAGDVGPESGDDK